MAVNVPMYEPSPQVLSRLKLLSERLRPLSANPRSINFEVRQELALMMAITFQDFRDFAYVGMKLLGFTLTPMQADIAQYMQHSPDKAMVSAQRGEAKSTLAALYAVWSLVQNQKYRVLIVSAASDQANEVASLVVRLLDTWFMLCYLKADPSLGDRSSYEKYDVHRDLKGYDKSPSVACVGLGSALAGKRADLLISDDIESSKNGLTQTEREKIKVLSKEFSAICTHGKILYLGTPQTKDSIYKDLPSRGYEVRIWTGRVPDDDMVEKYGATLAPYILKLIEDGAEQTGYGRTGTMGEATDPTHIHEGTLLDKEDEYGIEGFYLQYMLDTSLSDEMRTRIKLSDLLLFSGDTSTAPSSFSYIADRKYQIDDPHAGVKGVKWYSPASTGEPFIPYQHKLMVIDPASSGGDEVAFSIGGAASSYIHLFTVGGLREGMSTKNIDTLIDYAIEFGVSDLVIESNMGHGTVTSLVLNRLAERKIFGIGVRDINNTTQKERRIIDTVSPVTRRHRLIVHTRAIEDDVKYCMQHPADRRWLYSAFTQMQGITYDRGSLSKDDRVDAIAMMVAELSAHLIQDERKAAEKAAEKQGREFVQNPMGYKDYKPEPRSGRFQRGSTGGRRGRRKR
ncbi:DNA maturase B [Providencia phage vB_PstP_PS3]|uniref:DNA maturase B n=1 Tax=Providencia phage vB_PstP_PS3 TaxID=2848038 RepID=A0A411AWC8_9CAUD|nr:terminase large subunit [Providencia phage vB_PstP_PS3]QAX92389.1 DNA maturase B [Providencia phage vB_PstP_PS3]